ncbi:MAG: TrbC/VirB2 family protein [Gammaproteobacteria bacterium]
MNKAQKIGIKAQGYLPPYIAKSTTANRKLIDRLNAHKKNLCQQLLYTGLMLVSSPAFAEAGESSIEVALKTVIEWLTGAVGLSAGTLAVVGAGFAGLTGRMPIAYLKTIGMSLGIMYSAGYLAKLIIGE